MLKLLLSPLALSMDEFNLEQRWRLVATLFSQDVTVIAGSLARTAALVCAAWLSADSRFLALAFASIVVLGSRILLNRAFVRSAAFVQTNPETWAWRFFAGAMVPAAIWGLADILAVLWVRDQGVALFLITVQAGWLAGAAARNAVSPVTVVGQTALTILPSLVATLSSGKTILVLIAPFLLIQFGTILKIVIFVADRIASALQYEDKLERLNAKLQVLATTDPLTGMANRRAFETTLAAEWRRAARDSTDLSIIAIDVDRFKDFNDKHGHPAGDACLQMVAKVINDGVRRPPDFAARVGGEEFMALLPSTPLAGAIDVAERLRQAVIDAALPHASSPCRVVTISVGVYSVIPQSGTDPGTFVDEADRALYAAKQAGRNTVKART